MKCERRAITGIIGTVLAIYAGHGACHHAENSERSSPKKSSVPPIVSPRPSPLPDQSRPSPCPGPNCPRSLDRFPSTVFVGAKGGPISPDGTEQIDVDLPTRLWTQNTAGIDRAGLCVWTSALHACLWAGIAEGKPILDYLRTQEGGGWPERVDEVFRSKAPEVRYRQYTGRDPSLLEAVLRSGRMPCVTHTRSHMVNLIHLGQRWACVLDNNRTDPPVYLWYQRSQWLQLWTDGGYGWAFYFLPPGPPPVPWNRADPVGQVFPPGGVPGGRLKPRDRVWGPDGQLAVAQAVAELAGLDQPDGKPRPVITIIGPQDATSRVWQQIWQGTELASLASSCRIRRYTDQDWEVQDVGFVRPGPVVIYVQQQNGKVTCRLDDFPDEKDFVAAIRTARPDYDPANDPGIAKHLGNPQRLLALAFAVVLFIVIVRRK